MKRSSLLFSILLFLSALSSLYSQDIKIGVVEFEEKNNIGLENGGRIVAEWIITELNNTGKYKIIERLMLSQVLEEQKLMLSGVIDEAQVVQIGEIYGIDGVVTGSIMKVGEEIKITARIINVETAEVLKTASGSVDSLSNLEDECRVIANNLSDISREEFRVKEAIEEKKVQRMELGAGLVWSWDFIGYASPGVDFFLRYQHSQYSLWVVGNPVPDIQHIEVGASYNLTHYIGIGVAGGIYFDNEIDYVETRYLMGGIVARPVHNFELGLMFGGTLSGIIWTSSEGEQAVGGAFSFGNYLVWGQYRINETIGLQLRVTGTELSGFGEELPTGYVYPGTSDEYLGGKISLICIYSLPI